MRSKEVSMTKQEILEFIEEMGHIGDIWTEDQVKDVYGDMTLCEALNHRKPLVDMHLTNLYKAFTASKGE